MNNDGHLQSTLYRKKEFAELVAVAILVGLGIGILSSSFVSFYEIPSVNKFIVSGLITFLGLLILIRNLTGNLKFKQRIQCQLLLDEKNNILPIRNYDFSEEVCKTFQAIFQESKSLKKAWGAIEKCIENSDSPERSGAIVKEDEKEEQIEYFAVCKVEVEPSEYDSRTTSADELLKEVIEFVALEELSLHLSSYFNDYDNDDEIKEYQRSDTPEFLLNNRVFSTLTKPIEERDIFIDAFPDPDKRPKGEIHSLYATNGAMYKRFDLLLPKGTVINKIPHGGFKISNSRIELSVEIDYEGFSANFSSDFISLYMNKGFRETQGKLVYINLSGKVKPLSLFHGTGWHYYQWLDSYITRTTRSFSFPEFLNDINWKQISAHFFCQRQRQAKIRKMPESKLNKVNQGDA